MGNANKVFNRTYNIQLDSGQLDQIISILMSQLYGSAIPEKELKELEASYRDFKTTLEVGKSSESSGFLAKLRKFSNHVKDNPHYISVINLILSILK